LAVPEWRNPSLISEFRLSVVSYREYSSLETSQARVKLCTSRAGLNYLLATGFPFFAYN